MHVYRIDVETERDCEFEGRSEGKADIYGDSVHEINGRLWRLWGVPFGDRFKFCVNAKN